MAGGVVWLRRRSCDNAKLPTVALALTLRITRLDIRDMPSPFLIRAGVVSGTSDGAERRPLQRVPLPAGLRPLALDRCPMSGPPATRALGS